MNKGFTLLELMVTVIIIGILSSVALPQYTRAVNKARLSEAVTNLAAIQRGMDLYCTQFRSGSATFLTSTGSRLDIDFKDRLTCDGSGCSSKHFTYTGSCNPGSCTATVAPKSDSKWKAYMPTLTATRTPASSGLGASWSRSCTDGSKDANMCSSIKSAGFEASTSK